MLMSWRENYAHTIFRRLHKYLPVTYFHMTITHGCSLHSNTTTMKHCSVGGCYGKYISTCINSNIGNLSITIINPLFAWDIEYSSLRRRTVCSSWLSHPELLQRNFDLVLEKYLHIIQFIPTCRLSTCGSNLWSQF